MSKKNYLYELWELHHYNWKPPYLVGTYTTKAEAAKAQWKRSLEMNDSLVIGDPDEYIYEIKPVNKYKLDK